MIISSKRLVYPIVAIYLSLTGYAQQPPANSSSVALQAFEGAEKQEYTIGCGDQISIMVAGHAEATGKQIVGPDGVITLPYAGSIKISDLTREGAAKEITRALTPYYQDPSVVVGVDIYTSNNLLVLGAVEHPGLMPLDSATTLLSVISRAGMLPQAAGVILGKTASVPEQVTVFRGNQTVMSIDFKRALEKADPQLQMQLKKNDVVYIPSSHDKYVSVFGEVLHPGLVDLQDDVTLPQLLAEAGGIVTDRSGTYPKIQVIHESTGIIQTVDYADILQSKNIDLALKSGDIVYVPESKFDRLAVTFQKISPLISIATVATLIQHP